MTESAAFVLMIVVIGVGVAVLAIVVGNAGLRRFMETPRERSAMLILHDHAPRALYFVATMRGADAARIKKALASSDRRAFVWMTQSGRSGAPGRALLIDAITEVIAEGGIVWDGELTSAIEQGVRAKLRSDGVELISLRLAGQVAFDDDARARNRWWVCYADYELVGGKLCCDGLEFWMDSRGPGLWSLNTKDGRLSSVDVAGDAEFRLLCHQAHELPPELLGDALKDTRNLTLDEMKIAP